MKKISLILFSGGRESLINLHEESKVSDLITLVLYNYGQKSFKKELDALKYYAKKYGVLYQVIRLPITIPYGIKYGVDADDHVVNRNMLFISHLLNYASEFVKAKSDVRILVGTVRWRNKVYADGQVKFCKDINSIVQKMYPTVNIVSHANKIYGTNTHSYLIKKGIDISRIWLCMTDKKEHCGSCRKCLIIRREMGEDYTKETKQFLERIKLEPIF